MLIKEKLIFWFVLGVFLVNGVYLFLADAKKAKDSTYNGISEKIKAPISSQKQSPVEWKSVNKDELQDLSAFSKYESLVQKTPFFEKKLEISGKAEGTAEPVKEELTPAYLYKGEVALGNKLSVILVNPKTAETLFAAKGEFVEGYRVAEINADEVVLSKEGKETLKIKKKTEITSTKTTEKK